MKSHQMFGSDGKKKVDLGREKRKIEKIKLSTDLKMSTQGLMSVSRDTAQVCGVFPILTVCPYDRDHSGEWYIWFKVVLRQKFRFKLSSH